MPEYPSITGDVVRSVNGMTGDVTIPTGGGGGASSYSQSFLSPVTQVTVTHNLGYNPNVTVADSAGDELWCDKLYVNVNEVIVSFSAPTTGVVYCS